MGERVQRVLVVGGGVSGLSVALRLASASPFRRPHVTVVEREGRWGGWVHTHHLRSSPSSASGGREGGRGREQSFLFERGPRSLLARHDTLSLLQALGLHEERTGLVMSDPSAKRRFLYRHRPSDASSRLVALPTGLNSTLTGFPLLRPLLKAVWHEVNEKRREEDELDESVYDFISRRFSPEIARELMDPLVAGIYAGNTRQLSMRSCFKALWEAEQTSGSIVRSMLLSVKKTSRNLFSPSKPATPSPVECSPLDMSNEEMEAQPWVKKVRAVGTCSFRLGLQTIIDCLAQRLPSLNVDMRLHTAVNALRFRMNGAIEADINGEMHSFDRVVSTVSTLSLARILRASTVNAPSLSCLPNLQADLLDPHSSNAIVTALAKTLSNMSYADVFVVNVGYDAHVLPTSGFGFLCPEHEGSAYSLLGVAFDSCVFPEQNADQTQTRLTCMMGGARFPKTMSMSALAVEQMALDALSRSLAIVRPPTVMQVNRADQCIPQFSVGHHKWCESIESYLDQLNSSLSGPRLHVIGAALYGVSVNDLIRQAKRTADSILSS